eukprot:SAG22_NODE_694_length_7847_cov_4.425787_6_plen_305_part_01
MRAEQYRRTKDKDDDSYSGIRAGPAGTSLSSSDAADEGGGEESGSCCCGRAESNVQKEEAVPLLAGEGGKAKVKTTLGEEICGLCPLLVLIFVEVAALGLPVAILPIITTTEFAIARYDAPADLSYIHFDGTCTLGDWIPPVSGDERIPTGPECQTDENGDKVPVQEESEPCCLWDEDSQIGHLAYPQDSCPTGLDGFSDDTASEFFYPNLDACNRGNAFAAQSLGYADAAKNVLTFIFGGAVGAVSDSRGRKQVRCKALPLPCISTVFLRQCLSLPSVCPPQVLLWAEIVASLPNLALYLWWVF